MLTHKGESKHKFRYHQVVGSFVLFVDVTELPAVSLGFPDKYILFAFCCWDLLLLVV